MKNFFHKKSGNIKYSITDSNIEKELSVNLTEGFFLKKKGRHQSVFNVSPRLIPRCFSPEYYPFCILDIKTLGDSFLLSYVAKRNTKKYKEIG